MSKILIYGSALCPDTVAALEKLEREEIAYEYCDITDNLANLKAFLKYRDANSIFDAARAGGGIGIPFFIVSDGDRQSLSLDVDEVLGII